MKNFLVLIFSLLCLGANAQAPLSVTAYKAKVNTQVRIASGATSITKEIIAGLYDDLVNIVAIKADTATLATLVEWTDTVGGMIVTGYKLDTFKINIRAALAAHIANTSNPHSVTKTQVGLGNVDNTSDANKPISTATQAAITAHTSNVSNPHIVTKTQVGLGNADNTSDADKPVSTATQAAITAHTSNVSNPHSVTKTQVGLGNVDNTSDANKPVSTAVQAALDDTANAIRGDMPDGISTDSLYLGTLQQATTDSVFAWGNSITAGYGLAAVQDRWLNIVCDYFGLVPVNNAVSGTTLMKRTPVDPFASPNLMDNLASIPVKRPGIKLLVNAYSLNDIRVNAPDYDTANFRTDYKRWLDTCIARAHTGSGILLVTASYVTPTSYVSLGYGAATQARHLAFNYVVQTLAAEYGTYFADVYGHLAYYGGGENMQEDSVHLNKDGNKRYAQKIISVLQYPIEKMGQKFAVHGTAAFDKIIFRGSDTAEGDVTPLGVDKYGNIVRMPNSYIRNNSSAEKQGASGNINGTFTAQQFRSLGEIFAKRFSLSGAYANPTEFPGFGSGFYNGRFTWQPYISDGVVGGIDLLPFGHSLLIGTGLTWDGFSNVQIGGSLSAKAFGTTGIAATSGSPYSLDNNNSTLKVDATDGDKTVIAPVAGIATGRRFNIVNTAGANNIIIDPVGGALINGATTFTFANAAEIQFDGTNYVVLSSF